MQEIAIVSNSSVGVFEGQSEPDVIVLTNFIAEDNSHENRCCANVFVGYDHLVRYWQHQLAKRHNDTGSRQSVCETDLTSEFGSGFIMALVCRQDNAANAI